MKTILYAKEGGVGIIKLNRPETLNAIDETLVDDLKQLFDEIEKDGEIQGVVITSNSGRIFSSGADLKAIKMDDPEILKKVEEVLYKGQALYRKLDSFPKPIVAAINALALGGGVELTLVCHERVIVDGVKVGFPETAIGLLPSWGGTVRLSKIVGKGIASEMILTGGQINAKQAYELGLVNKVVGSTEELIPAAIERVKELAK